MLKTGKKILCTLLVIVMCLTAAPLEGFVGLNLKAEATSYKVGDIIQFGSYPQSKITDSATITALNAKAPSWSKWTSYGYYSGTGSEGSMVQGDWMRYTDITYNGNKYRGVKFTQYRPNWIYCNSSSLSNTLQDDNGYSTNTAYWFKFESIDWRILDPATGLLMCETIIDSQPYSNAIYYNSSYDSTYAYFNNSANTNYASDYETSSIRKWLNNDFYNTAFTDSEKKEISTTTLNNDGYNTSNGTTAYEKLDSNETKDKIFLLSYNEIRNSEFGFNSIPSTYDAARFGKGSDYAQSQGLYVSRSSSVPYNGNSLWLLRSSGHNSHSSCSVDYFGYSSSGICSVYITNFGVRPAISLNRISGIVNPNDPSNIDGAVEFNGNYYKFFDEGLDWQTANSYCFDIGGHLAAITSQEEQSFIESQLSSQAKNMYWIGGTEKDEKWTWTTGEYFSYTHWGDGEPNNKIHEESYLQIYAKNFKKKFIGDWNDASIDGAAYSDEFYSLENTGFICEWEYNTNSPDYPNIPDTTDNSSLTITQNPLIIDAVDASEHIITATYYNENGIDASNFDIKWTSTDKSVIEVLKITNNVNSNESFNSALTFKANNIGSTKLTAHYDDKKVDCYVFVKEISPQLSIKVENLVQDKNTFTFDIICKNWADTDYSALTKEQREKASATKYYIDVTLPEGFSFDKDSKLEKWAYSVNNGKWLAPGDSKKVSCTIYKIKDNAANKMVITAKDTNSSECKQTVKLFVDGRDLTTKDRNIIKDDVRVTVNTAKSHKKIQQRGGKIEYGEYNLANKILTSNEIPIEVTVSNNIPGEYYEYEEFLRNNREFDYNIFSIGAVDKKGFKSIKFDIPSSIKKSLKKGESITLYGTAILEDNYLPMPNEQQSKELALSVAVKEVFGNIKTGSFSSIVKNISYKPKVPAISTAAKELANTPNTVCDLKNLAYALEIPLKQCEHISKLVAFLLAVFSLPEESLQKKIDNFALEKFFGYQEKNNVKTGTFTVTIPMTINNQKKEVDLINTVTISGFNGTVNAKFDSIGYEVYRITKNRRGKETREPEPYEIGSAGVGAYASFNKLISSIEDYVLEAVSEVTDVALGDPDDAAKFLFGKCAHDVLVEAGYESFFEYGWSVYSKAWNEVIVECPVDVYVYDSNDNLCGTIINNCPSEMCDDVELEVVNDDKIIKLRESGYYIKTIATAEGTMSISVSENDYNNGARRIVSYKNLPLSVGTEYLQNYGEGFNVDSSVYDVIYEDGSVQAADEELMLLTDKFPAYETIKFGSYPQSQVTDSKIISALNSKAPAWSKWTSYNYYTGTGSVGTMKQGDWMKYTDVTYNGTKYRGVKFTQYRPYLTFDESNAENSFQDANGFNPNTVYWFKFEPINWLVLDSSKGKVVCENIIDAQAYSNTIYKNGGGSFGYFNDTSYENYASNYETSSIRKWLNNDFYNTAFTESEKAKIGTAVLKNDSYYTKIGTTGYEKLDSNQTKDKVFILTYSDVITSKYGFSTNASDSDIARQAQGSDYAKSQGLYTYNGSESHLQDNSLWMLRTAGSNSYNFCRVNYDGSTGESFNNVYRNCLGIRPALLLKDISNLDKDEDTDKVEDTNKEDTDNSNKTCSCQCHKTSFFAKIIWKFKIFFQKIFRKNKQCACGINHY